MNPELETLLGEQHLNVTAGDYLRSEELLISQNFCHCSGLALYNGHSFALAHLYPRDDAFTVLWNMLHEGMGPGEENQAIIVAPEKKKAHQINDQCCYQQIRVVGSYWDAWYQDRPTMKDVVVLPSTQEVFIFAGNKKFTRQFRD